MEEGEEEECEKDVDLQEGGKGRKGEEEDM